MKRKNFEEILKNAKVDIPREYSRLRSLMYSKRLNVMGGCYKKSLHDIFNMIFTSLDIRGTALSLDDFDQTYNFFYNTTKDVVLDDLVSFCEYFYNLLESFWRSSASSRWDYCVEYNFLINQIDNVIDSICYKKIERDNITIFIPVSQETIAVAEIIDDSASYDVLYYNHHSLKGDLEAKKSILIKLAKLLEPKRKPLEKINQKLATNLFFAFNCMDIRHNNTDSDKKGPYKETVAKMSIGELESNYDDIYQMALVAFLLLDNIKRMEKFNKLKCELKENI